jgi:hypothetical protein
MLGTSATMHGNLGGLGESAATASTRTRTRTRRPAQQVHAVKLILFVGRSDGCVYSCLVVLALFMVPLGAQQSALQPPSSLS